MKKIFILALAVIGFQLAEAQAWNGGGDQKFQAGVNLWGKGDFGVIGSYDYGLFDPISVGAGAAIYFKGKKHTEDNRDRAELSVYGRGDVHLQKLIHLPEHIDIYPGVTVGVIGSFFDFGAHLGFRYFFSDSMGVFAEVGNRGGFGVVLNL